MRAGVDHSAGLGRVPAAHVAVGELHDVHAGNSGLRHERANGRRDHAKVLGDERQRAELRIGRLEELGTRAEVELALAGLLALGDRVVRREPDEVVEAHVVVHVERTAEAA